MKTFTVYYSWGMSSQHHIKAKTKAEARKKAKGMLVDGYGDFVPNSLKIDDIEED